MVLLVAVVLIILVGSIHTVTLSSHRQTARYGLQTEARYAALAGFQVALSRLKIDENHVADVTGHISYDPTLTYRVKVENNATGLVAIDADDGTKIPPGSVYLTSTAGRQPYEFGLTAMLSRDTAAPPYNAVFAATGIDMAGNSEIQAVGGSGPFVVGTNVESPGNITVTTNATIAGSVSIGPAGDPATALTVSGNGEVTGGVQVASALVNNPPQAPPTVSPPFTDVVVSNNDSLSLPPGNYGQIRLVDNAEVRLSSGTYYIDQDFTISGNTEVRCDSRGGPIVIYVNGTQLRFSTNSDINLSGGPEDVRLYMVSILPSSFVLGGNSEAHMVVYAPTATAVIRGNAELRGSLVAEHLRLQGNSDLTYDRSLNPSATGSSTGRWVLHSQKTVAR